MKKPIKLILLLTIILFFLVTITAFAQGTGSPPPPPGSGASPLQNPIDGGLALLAAAGGGYAIKKLRERKH